MHLHMYTVLIILHEGRFENVGTFAAVNQFRVTCVDDLSSR